MIEDSVLKKLEMNEMEFFALHRSERTITDHYVALISVEKNVLLWNFAGSINADSGHAEALVNEIEEIFKSKSIAPALRITPWTEPSNLVTVLLERGYAPALELSTMIHQGVSINGVHDGRFEVKQARTDREIELFTDLQILGFGGSLDGKEWYLETNHRNSSSRITNIS